MNRARSESANVPPIVLTGVLLGILAVPTVASADATNTMPSPRVDTQAPLEDGDENTIEQLELIVESLRTQRSRAARLPDPATDADFLPRDGAKENLGRFLYFDKILSGNLNTSCATCHHPFAGTSDGLSLGVGEGAQGLSVTRDTGTGPTAVPERVPRNAPHIYNLGATQFTRMFHDGRVEVDPAQPSGFRSPAGNNLPAGLDSALAVQAMFPPTSTTEMAGQAGESAVGDLAAAGNAPGVWEALAARLRAIPEYVTLFMDAYDDIEAAEDITFVHAANAIAAFEAAAFRADDSPFDRFLRGDRQAMSTSQKKGMELFYGRAGCSTCHSGTFQTDHGFYVAAMPQIGPGKGDNFTGFADGCDDFGRERVTGEIADRYRFRVPSLRNVALTGPWGHDGAFNSLEAVVQHMLDPASSIEAYDPAQAVLPTRPDLDAFDQLVMSSAARRGAIAAASEITPVTLNERQFARLIDFLHALTDTRSLDLRQKIPTSVPSGLPVYD